MQEMRRQFDRENYARKDKLGQHHGSEGRIEGVVKEAEIARREHIKPPPKGNVKEMIKKVRGNFQKMGVSKMMHNQPHAAAAIKRGGKSRW